MRSPSSHHDPAAAAYDILSVAPHFENRAHILQLKWAALRNAADAVSALASMKTPPPADELQALPETIQNIGGWRLDHAVTAVDDLAAVMEQGLAALLSARAKGANASAAASALWREFEAAASAILLLAPPPTDTPDQPASGKDVE